MLIPIDRPLIDGRNTRDAATQTVIAGFVATHNQRSVLLLTCDGVDRTSAAPHIQAGVKAGQKLLILVTDDANRVTIYDGGGAGTNLNGHWVVADGKGIGAKIWLVWDGTRWWEVDRKNGELNASGLVAHAEGKGATASGSYSHAEGDGTLASGNFSSHAEGISVTVSGNDGAHGEGYSCIVGGSSAHAQGERAVANLRGEHAQASGKFSSTGDAQFNRVVARILTTNATLTETFLDGIDDLLTILDEYTYACKITVVGRQNTGEDNFMGTYHVLVERTGETVGLVGAVDIIYENNAGGWGAGGGLPVSILAGATNLEVWVEGLAGHNIRWVVTVEMTRVRYSD